jgi:restriction endonuclease S subunit
MRKLILDITKPAVNQASFTVKDLCNLNVMLPPMSEQEEFVAIVKQADKSKYFS